MTVDCVVDGPQALEHLRRASRDGAPYDLAILDYQMPGMNGLDLARAIKGTPGLADLRLLMITSFGDRSVRAQARSIPIEGYLGKPVRQSQLLECIATVMGIGEVAQGSKPEGHDTLTATVGRMSVRVLVVEDNVINQRVAMRMLEKLGCRVDVVANGLEAIHASATIGYDCIFMDCQMPEMDGFAATNAIRQREQREGNRIPIIAMTANAMQGDRERCLTAGMDDYIAKPVKSADLLTMLQAWTRPARDAAARERQVPGAGLDASWNT
jgi:CheY-like chemotaxis protein